MTATTTEAPVRTITIQPTRTKVNPTKVGDNAHTTGRVLYVTVNEDNRRRALVSSEVDLEVGDKVLVKHAARSTSYGVLTIVAMVDGDDKSGEVLDESLPLRVIVAEVVAEVEADEVEIEVEAPVEA